MLVIFFLSWLSPIYYFSLTIAIYALPFSPLRPIKGVKRVCLIIVPDVRTRIYAFGAPAYCLRVRCTNHLLIKHWLIRGEAYQYIDHVVCFSTKKRIIQPIKTTITTLRDISLRSCVPTDILFVFNNDCIEAFKELKDRLIFSPILYYYNLDLKLILEIDTFNGVVAEILSQLYLDNE